MQILLADDHDLVRDAISLLLKRDFGDPQIDMVGDLNGILEKLKESDSYDLVLMDVQMPGMRGIVSVAEVIDLAGETPVALMSGAANLGDIKIAYDYGIRGFIPKTTTGKALSNVLRLILAGERYIPSVYMERDENFTVPTTGAKLTSREIEVMKHLLKGQSNKQIAAALFIEETTVKLHLRSLYDKLEAKNRTDAVIKAMQLGLSGLF